MNYFYHYPLVDKIGENLVVAHLNRLEAVKIILDSFDGAKDKEMLYFLKSGEMKILSMEEIKQLSIGLRGF